MQITYQKKDGGIIQRFRNTALPYKVGDTTSMGWKVLNIKYEYNDKYYSEREYCSLLNKNKKKVIKKKENLKLFKKEIKKFLYYFISIMIIYFVKLLLKI